MNAKGEEVAELEARMSPERRARVRARADKLIEEMPLHELRRARELTQQQLAEALGMEQGNISKLERRTDMYVSTLRSFVEALGGSLEIIARFPDGEVRIGHFSTT
ncbi:MAG: XRE family transcriptional regulator [Longimicrobiales bacterium]